MVFKSISDNKTNILDSLYNADSKSSSDESIPITYSEMEEILNDPDQIIEEISKMENGDAIIDFLYAVSSGVDPMELLPLAEKILPEEGFKEEIALFNEYKQNALVASRASTPTAGQYAFLWSTAGVQLAAAIFYAATPWVTVSAKLGAATALAVSVVAFGSAILLMYNPSQTPATQIVEGLIAGAAYGYSFAVLSAMLASAFGIDSSGAAIISGAYVDVGILDLIIYIINIA